MNVQGVIIHVKNVMALNMINVQNVMNLIECYKMENVFAFVDLMSLTVNR